MASEISKAQKRQSVRKKGFYQSQFLRSIKNKIRRIRRHVTRHPNDAKGAERLKYWTTDGQRTRTYTKEKR